MTQKEDWILSLSKEQKLEFIRELGKRGEVGMFVSFTQILLDAPIKDGGLSVEEVDNAWKNK